jgi:hypothetical protein
MTLTDPSTRRRFAYQGRRSQRRWWPVIAASPTRLLAVVAVLYFTAQLLVVSPRFGPSWDETVYLTQVSGKVPPANFTAPRARGILVLIAPVASQTDNIVVLRVYLAALSALALFAAYGLWLRVCRTHAVPLAALLFGGLWTTMFNGSAVMPNIWVAFGTVAATALVVLVARAQLKVARGPGPPPQVPGEITRATLVIGLALVLAFIALVRPSDSVFLALGLAAALAWRLKHRLRLVVLPYAAICAGTALGWAQWVIEAESRYGGLMARLRAASELNGGGFSLLNFIGDLRAVDGPNYCGPECNSGISVLEAGLWIGLLVGCGVALMLNRRSRLLAVTALPIAVAAPIAAQYAFLIANAAPRFLLPVYALLALPCAAALLRLPHHVPVRAKRPVVAMSIIGVLCYLTAQQTVLADITGYAKRDQARINATVEELRLLGITPPCLVSGTWSLPVGYALGCRAHGYLTPTATKVPMSLRNVIDKGHRLAVISRHTPEPDTYVWDWDIQIAYDREDQFVVWVYLPPQQSP